MTQAHGWRVNALKTTIIGTLGIIIAILGFIIIFSVSQSSTSIEIRLGDDDFRGISSVDLADEIAKNGPVPFPDLVGRNRPIWVTHAGIDPKTNWYAFLAQVPNESSACNAQWDKNNSEFFSSCQPEIKFPPNGNGLKQLEWSVTNGELRILINTSGAKNND